MFKLCDYEYCSNQAFYGYYYAKPTMCKEHKENRKQQYKICVCGKHSPTYNFEGEKRAKYCKECKEPNMISMTGYKCKCGKSPIFNFENEKKPICCKNCKEPAMIDISNKCKCGKGSRIYNVKGKPPKFCKECKKDDMVNTRSSRCECKKGIPIYNYKGKKPKYCKECKKDDMEDVKHDKCPCGIIATYNFPGETKGICCKKCKKKGMKDVKNKECKCGKTFLLYNYPGESKGICCIDCKKDDMVDVVHSYCKCNTIATFNYEYESTPICCSKCRSEDMVNISDRSKRCKGQEGLCTIAGNPKYRGYCTFCFSHEFPKDPLTFKIREKTKEMATRDFINSNYEGFHHDEVLWVSDGCDCTHKRRIDHRKLIGNTMLCIETDEDQHKKYDKNDEIFRYNDIYSYFSGKYIFIRYNPDPYINKNGEKVDPDWNVRFNTLKIEIDKHLRRIRKEENEELLEIHHLFYNYHD